MPNAKPCETSKPVGQLVWEGTSTRASNVGGSKSATIPVEIAIAPSARPFNKPNGSPNEKRESCPPTTFTSYSHYPPSYDPFSIKTRLSFIRCSFRPPHRQCSKSARNRDFSVLNSELLQYSTRGHETSNFIHTYISSSPVAACRRMEEHGSGRRGDFSSLFASFQNSFVGR